MGNTMKSTQTIAFKVSHEDRSIMDGKGTQNKFFILTVNTGFMALYYDLYEYSKIPFLPFTRSRLIGTWEDDQELALEALAQAT